MFPVVKEVKCKTALNKSKISDYCINSYIGCEHGCEYCYSDFLTRRYYDIGREWGSYVYPKVNIVSILKKEITKKKKGCVFLSSLCDPYQPLEKKYSLTRGCLKVLKRNGFEVVIQTKSPLILRDLDVIKEMKCEVGFTVVTTNEDIRKIFEPNAPPIEKRLKAVEKLRRKGISTYLFIGPFLPILSEEDLQKLVRFGADVGVSRIFLDKLNLRPGLLEKLESKVKIVIPSKTEEWKNLVVNENYWKETKKRFVELCERNRVKYEICF